MQNLGHNTKFLIVGAGCFGISTALHLLKRGYVDVTVIDRAQELPAVDAASSDINKIIRSSYSDPFYAQLAREAIKNWKNREDWGSVYHESSCVIIAKNDARYQNDVRCGANIRELTDMQAMQAAFPAIKLGPAFINFSGHAYVNYDGGWAEAANGVKAAMQKVKDSGGKVLPGKCVTSLIKDGQDGKTKGVHCEDGSEFMADVVIIATGAWTASVFPHLKLEERCRATGMSLIGIQLTEEQAERYSSCPVILDAGAEYFILPPNNKNIIKLATESIGHVNPLPNKTDGISVSTPRTILSHGEEGLHIPVEAANILKHSFANYFPEVANNPLAFTRLCWYTDSPDEDWIIDIHPSDPSLMIMTAGSGHGYKFLPIIGSLAVDRLEGKMAPKLQKKFAVDRSLDKEALSGKAHAVRELKDSQLCGVKDLA